MPYIKQSIRVELNGPLNDVIGIVDQQANRNKAGCLNYIFSCLLKAHIDSLGMSYVVINEAIGVFECCKLELYRRLAADYEDQKCIQNGDVFND